jgi:hypothetical protein
MWKDGFTSLPFSNFLVGMLCEIELGATSIAEQVLVASCYHWSLAAISPNMVEIG